jgi:uncharacterized damage-inducible protein DinB
MDVNELLLDGFGRAHEGYGHVLDGLTTEQANRRPGATGNSITWLLWHIARVQDEIVADLAGAAQVWPDWYERFALQLPVGDDGYGHTSAEVDAVRVSDLELLRGYHDAVAGKVREYVRRLTQQDLDRIVDTSYDPPVSCGVRLISAIEDSLQHVGQAAYAKGLPAT